MSNLFFVLYSVARKYTSLPILFKRNNYDYNEIKIFLNKISEI